MSNDMKNNQIDPRETGPDAAGSGGLAGLRVLLAEDNDINWKIISELLKANGISPHRAKDGQACMEMLSRVPAGTFGLILMDVQMPVMDGLEASKVIRGDARSEINSIPIIAMTAGSLTEDVAACREAGMNGHVSKPVDIDMLLREIRRVLEKPRP